MNRVEFSIGVSDTGHETGSMIRTSVFLLQCAILAVITDKEVIWSVIIKDRVNGSPGSLLDHAEEIDHSGLFKVEERSLNDTLVFKHFSHFFIKIFLDH